MIIRPKKSLKILNLCSGQSQINHTFKKMKYRFYTSKWQECKSMFKEQIGKYITAKNHFQTICDESMPMPSVGN